MKLTTDATLLFLLAADNGIFVFFTTSTLLKIGSRVQVWTMKLTESMNIYLSVRIFRTIKVNIKETFMGNDPFLQMFIW